MECNEFSSNYTLQRQQAQNDQERPESEQQTENEETNWASQNKQITSESNKSKVSKQLFLVPALLGGNLLLSAKAAFDAPNTQHWTLNALNMLKIALTQSDCCTVYIEYTKEVQQYTPKTKFSLFFEHNILTECPGWKSCGWNTGPTIH